ncbi:hypothetical protein B0H13DRAFT_1870807 [Mycena leptocephala]|nr:hypothetical protein B0H13DRAFT_1870807 [Mycena leptocephala]
MICHLSEKIRRLQKHRDKDYGAAARQRWSRQTSQKNDTEGKESKPIRDSTSKRSRRSRVLGRLQLHEQTESGEWNAVQRRPNPEQEEDLEGRGTISRAVGWETGRSSETNAGAAKREGATGADGVREEPSAGCEIDTGGGQEACGAEGRGSERAVRGAEDGVRLRSWAVPEGGALASGVEYWWIGGARKGNSSTLCRSACNWKVITPEGIESTQASENGGKEWCRREADDGRGMDQGDSERRVHVPHIVQYAHHKHRLTPPTRRARTGKRTVGGQGFKFCPCIWR